MKKILNIVFSIISLTLIVQAPQDVDYQCVTADDKCLNLVNQFISIRASVLTGSTNGTQTSFVDNFWGTNINFLKIEIDI